MKEAVWTEEREERQEAPARETESEAQWRQRLVQGDLDVIGVLYDHYAASLYRVLTAILGSAADAEDALQEVFVRLAQGRARRIQNLRPYLFAAARHEACTILRRKRRERPLEEGERLSHTMDAAPAIEMQRLLQRLPLEQREVIAMKVYEELTFAEIAAIVKSSPNTVASRYRYGIQRLRAWIQEEEAYENRA